MFSFLKQYVLPPSPIDAICTQTASFRLEKKGPLILDLGTGTGIWAIEIADKVYGLRGEVCGVDLAWTQPAQIPINIEFLQRDVDLPWYDLAENVWDFVHIRMLNGGVTDWPSVYRRALRLLKRGQGWIEHLEIDLTPRCDDGSFPSNSALNYWTRVVLEATEQAGQRLSYNEETRLLLNQTGFEDIQEHIVKIPLNPWPTDQNMKEVGRWYNLGFSRGLQAMALAPLTRMKDWRIEQVNQLCDAARKEICCQSFHVYHNLHIWNARRPETI
ncbi:hypothetical protein K3495_g5018 [Podosphaera aphanis]|nr:hypothetical protein K3495_g5018 [Podosphaera aphanis]